MTPNNQLQKYKPELEEVQEKIYQLLKNKKCYQSEVQKLFESNLVEVGGGEYHTVRSIDDVIKIGL